MKTGLLGWITESFQDSGYCQCDNFCRPIQVRIFDFSAVTAIVDRSVGAMRKAG